MIQICRNGAYVQGLVESLGDTSPGPCPALVDNDNGSFSCGIVLNPKKYFRKSKYRPEVLSREFGRLIGAGTGCDEIGCDNNPDEEEKLLEFSDAYQADQEKMKHYKNAIRIIHGIDT